MRARVGDLALARWDDCETLCVVCSGNMSGCSPDKENRRILYWHDGKKETYRGDLPRTRLIRVKPKKSFSGSLFSLTTKDVVVIK